MRMGNNNISLSKLNGAQHGLSAKGALFFKGPVSLSKASKL